MPIPQHDSLLGRLVRLLSAVYFPTLRGAAGELLFAICDSDPMTLSSLVGYGNVAGFLFNKGIMSAPGTTSTSNSSSANANASTSDAERINPITGTYFSEESSADDEMTEEEKEREAEKLFVLFDRLERSGIAQNPIRQAQQSGKLDAIADQMRKQKESERGKKGGGSEEDGDE